MSKVFLVATIAAIVAGASVFLYIKYTSPSASQNSNPQIAERSPQPASSASTEPKLSPTPTTGITLKDTQNAINATINKEDRSPLLPFFQKTDVAFALYASDCCPPQSAQDAIKQLVYIDAGLPMTFNQENAIIKNLKAKNPQLSESFVGISTTNEHLLAFTIDDKTHLIKAIQMSVSYKLYTQ